MALFKVKPWYKKRNGVLSKYGWVWSNCDVYGFAATTVGNYAIFHGSESSGSRRSDQTYSAIFPVFDKSLTQTSVLGTYRDPGTAATTVGDYAIFAGHNNSSNSKRVDVFDKSLTYIDAIVLRLNQRYNLAASTVGDYAIFAGGDTGGGHATNAVDIFNKSLTVSYNNLSSIRRWFDATSVGDYAIFGGGLGSSSDKSPSLSLDVYDKYLTLSNPQNFVNGHSRHAATTVGNYAMFTGGVDRNGQSTRMIDIYDKSLTHTHPVQLSTIHYEHSATTIKEYAIFAGGYGSSGMSKSAEAFNESLTAFLVDDLQGARTNSSASSVGDYAIFVGGNVPTDQSRTVDIYQVT